MRLLLRLYDFTFENIAPKAKLNPAINNQALAVQIYGNADMLLRPLSSPRNITLRYVSIHPTIIRLFKCGLDILMYLKNEEQT